MMSALLTVAEIHTYYGDSYVLQGLSLTLHKGRSPPSSAATAWARPR